MSDEKFRSEWEELTVVQLREELEGRGLNTSGRKSELVARLDESDQQMQMQPAGEQEGVAEVEMKDEEKEEETDFVVWADDDETLDDDKKREMRNKAVQDGAEPSSAIEVQDEKVDNGVAKSAKKNDFQVDVAKDKDMFILTWHGQKICVPFRDEVMKDLKHFSRQQNIIVYPIELVDVYDEPIRPLIEMAMNVSMELDETVPGLPIKGYLRMKFGSNAEATHAMDVIKEYKPEGRELTLQHFGENDSESNVLLKVKGKEMAGKDQLIQRLVFVSNFPSNVTEADIKEHFGDALRVIVPGRDDTSERIGYAYLEYPTEAAAGEAVTNYKDAIIGGQVLYVIKAMTEKKESYGLLRDNLRKYWLEQVKSFEAIKAKPNNNKTVRELQDIETKLHRYKRRIDKDNKKREDLGLPVPEDEGFSTIDLDSDKEEPKEKVKETTTPRENKPIEKKINPPPVRRRFSPPSSRGSFNSRFSGRGGFRGGASSFGRSPSSRSGPIGRPAGNLMNQLQELVGALAHKLPAESSRFDYDDAGFNSRSNFYDSRGSGSRGGFGGGYRGGDFGGSGGRFEGKRPSDGDFGGDRKRRPDDEYMRYGGGRGDYSGSFGSRRGGYNY